MMLVLWAMHPRAGTQEAPKHSKAPRSSREAREPQETGPPEALSSIPLQDGSEAKAPEPSRPLRPDPGAMLAKRKARRESVLEARDPAEYLKGIPPGLGDRGRDAALRTTAEHLLIEAGARPAFQAAARQSVQDLEHARVLRSREVSALGEISPSVGDEWRRSQERYAAAREAALGRLEPYLGQSPAAQEFRQEFDSWAALVVSKGQKVNR